MRVLRIEIGVRCLVIVRNQPPPTSYSRPFDDICLSVHYDTWQHSTSTPSAIQGHRVHAFSTDHSFFRISPDLPIHITMAAPKPQATNHVNPAPVPEVSAIPAEGSARQRGPVEEVIAKRMKQIGKKLASRTLVHPCVVSPQARDRLVIESIIGSLGIPHD